MQQLDDDVEVARITGTQPGKTIKVHGLYNALPDHVEWSVSLQAQADESFRAPSVLVEVGALEVARSRLITLVGAATVTS